MFRHKGKTRTFRHNLGIATILSFVAGMVNVSGFFAVAQLTTNVTGHFAFMADEVFHKNYDTALQYALFIIFFFAGSFVSNLMVEYISIRKRDRYTYIAPAVLEGLILLALGWWGQWFILHYPAVIAFGLLFAMGLQNSLVTTISKSIVRTTHLTGLFTDLGIELSQLFFYKKKEERDKLKLSMKLRFYIILFFFLGGLSGGMLYSRIGLKSLMVAAVILLIGLFYDEWKLRVVVQIRKTAQDANSWLNRPFS